MSHSPISPAGVKEPLPSVADTTNSLSPANAELIRATLPVVGAAIEDITRTFYARMFAAHPELLSDLFSRGNQARGAQQKSLAASIATFATHLVDPNLPSPAAMLARIGHKHASLGITEPQYAVVHRHLFAAIVEILGADVVTPEIAAAWDEVYWLMARTLIDFERTLYAKSGVADGEVFTEATVVGREEDVVQETIILRLRPKAVGPFTHARGGQFVSVGVKLPDNARQLRQYSIIEVNSDGEITIAIKPVAGTPTSPPGEVSQWLAKHAHYGTKLDLTFPFGNFVLNHAATGPLVLISAGIGVTPILGLLSELRQTGSTRKVIAHHADGSPASQPLRRRYLAALAELPDARGHLWYSIPHGQAEDTLAGETAVAEISVHDGRLTLTAGDVPAGAAVYLCGPDLFIAEARDHLLSAGIEAAALHTELFSPDDWLLGS